MTRLAVVATHPIQYYAPWFRHLATTPELDVRVFYLWDFGVTQQVDAGFGHAVEWDVPLLDGYAHEFVPNVAARPGTSHFGGLDNPELPARLRAWGPEAVLLTAYRYRALLPLLMRRTARGGARLLFRGDSHRLLPEHGARAWLRARAIRAAFQRFDAALYVGEANRRYFAAHGMKPERLFFAPHAVDNARFVAAEAEARREAPAWRAEIGIPEGRRVVLFVGKFQPKKRPLDLLEAFRRAELADVALLFVGAGELEEEVRAKAKAVPNVYFAPFQNQSRMPTVYAAGDVVVLPSFGRAETWGLVVNEAMNLGVPAIVSSHVGCGLDLIEEGVTGRTFPAGDVAALAAALRDAFAESDRLARWGAAARERVARHSYEAATRGLLDALASLSLAAS